MYIRYLETAVSAVSHRIELVLYYRMHDLYTWTAANSLVR